MVGGGGAGGGRRRGDTIQNQKQEPRTKMWGKNKNKIRPAALWHRAPELVKQLWACCMPAVVQYQLGDDNSKQIEN